MGAYGRCWYPVGVPAGWQPYTVGHWGWGDYGWTWVSADPWGDWTYRYGTWTFQPPWGWVWVPGYVWAPAWVTWSYSNDYIGWAPIPPTFSFAVTGYFGAPVVVNRSWYCFVPKQRFTTTNVYNVRVPVNQNQVILARSQKVTRFPVSGGVVRNEGIDLRNVERSSPARVQRVSAREMRRRAGADRDGADERAPHRGRGSGLGQVRGEKRSGREGHPGREETRFASAQRPGEKGSRLRRRARASACLRSSQAQPERDVSRPAAQAGSVPALRVAAEKGAPVGFDGELALEILEAIGETRASARRRAAARSPGRWRRPLLGLRPPGR